MPSQFSLPKSGSMMPPKKANVMLDAQSDAAIGLPTKATIPVKKFDKNSLPKSGKGMKAMPMKG